MGTGGVGNRESFAGYLHIRLLPSQPQSPEGLILRKGYTMYAILECAACAVLLSLVGALLFAAGVACIVSCHGVQAIVRTAHSAAEVSGCGIIPSQERTA